NSSTFSSSSLDISIPSFAVTFIPLYAGGLWEAVIIIPPLYPSFLVANCKHGVGTKPHTAESNPVELNAEDTIFDIMILDSLPSYPTRIGPFLKKLAIDKVISETKSRVRVFPNIPLMPFVPNNLPILPSTIDKFVLKVMVHAGVAKPGQRRRA